MEEAAKALSKTKIGLLERKNTFFTTILFSLRQVFDHKEVKTLATDGTHLFINPEFFLSISKEERMACVMRILLHIALRHNQRMKGKNRGRWNASCDYVANLMLKDMGYKCIDPDRTDEQFRNKSTEEIYRELPEGNEVPVPNQSVLQPDKSDIEHKQHVQAMLVRGSVASRMAGDDPGSIPGEVQVFLDGFMNPKLPWDIILRRYVVQRNRGGYNYKKPNRRYFPQYYLPSSSGKGIKDLVIAVDISGSVSDEDFKSIMSEVHTIFKLHKPEKITLIQFDTEIKHIDIIRTAYDFENIKFTGRGGTSVQCVFDWANKNEPEILLLFSDGEFHIPKTKYEGELLWLVYNKSSFNPGYGTVIHYDMNT